jgi:hypothetical protein
LRGDERGDERGEALLHGDDLVDAGAERRQRELPSTAVQTCVAARSWSVEGDDEGVGDGTGGVGDGAEDLESGGQRRLRREPAQPRRIAAQRERRSLDTGA